MARGFRPEQPACQVVPAVQSARPHSEASLVRRNAAVVPSSFRQVQGWPSEALSECLRSKASLVRRNAAVAPSSFRQVQQGRR